jgi:hypothetical protein
MIVGEFKSDASVGEVRDWIENEFGTGWRITVAHTRKELTHDKSMTVTSADLAPSAMLKLDLNGQTLSNDNVGLSPLTTVDTEDILPNGRAVEEVVRYEGFWTRLWKRILSWLNPFPNARETEDLFMTKE